MRGEVAGETYDGTKRLQRHSPGQPWSKSRGKQGGGEGVIVIYGRVRVVTVVSGERGFRDSGRETGDTQVGD